MAEKSNNALIQPWELRPILIVEDDEGLNNLIQRSLRKAGYNTEGVMNGSTAIDRIIADSDLVLILDINLPDMTGRDIIKILIERGYSVPFIVMTGYGDERTAVEMMKLGARDYLIKGLDFTDMLPDVVGHLFHELETEQRLHAAEDALKKSEEQYRMIFNNAPLGIMHFDSEGIISDFNDKFIRIMGATRKKLLGFNMFERLRDEAMLKAVKDALNGKIGYYEGDYLSVTGGKLVPIMAVYQSITDEKGLFMGAVGIFEDITSRKHAEEQLKASLREKEILLKEIHHRVNNNLSVILGLLDLQFNKIGTGEQALAAFRESRDRIYSMALVHRMLYEKTDLSCIDMEEYICYISSNLKNIYAPDRNIMIETEAKEISLNINLAIPLGLILNELITNALKHAFPDIGGSENQMAEQKNVITINLEQNAEEDGINTFSRDSTLTSPQAMVLTVSDNGIGLQEHIRIDTIETLGLKLVSLLTTQIGGTVSIQRNKGTEFNITFRV
jgi:two-component system response regulator